MLSILFSVLGNIGRKKRRLKSRHRADRHLVECMSIVVQWKMKRFTSFQLLLIAGLTIVILTLPNLMQRLLPFPLLTWISMKLSTPWKILTISLMTPLLCLSFLTPGNFLFNLFSHKVFNFCLFFYLSDFYFIYLFIYLFIFQLFS